MSLSTLNPGTLSDDEVLHLSRTLNTEVAERGLSDGITNNLWRALDSLERLNDYTTAIAEIREALARIAA